MNDKWFVFYTRSRQEKKVDDLLKKRGFESYLPLHTVMRQWSDRRKKVEVPLFASYIFVQIEEHAIQSVLQVPGVAWTIRLNGKPAVLHPKELETIRRFIETGLQIDTSELTDEFFAGDRVKVMDGPLKGAEGILLHTHNRQHHFTMALASIGQVITVEIDIKIVKRINE